MEACFSKFGNVFWVVDSEDKQIEILEEKGYIEPILFPYESKYEEFENKDGDEVLDSKIKWGIYVSSKKVLQASLKIPSIYDTIVDYIKQLQVTDDFIQNYLQASMWHNKYSKEEQQDKAEGKKTENSMTLGLAVYFDDFVAGAVLGANALQTKFGAVYVQILSLPPHLASKLSTILFSTLGYTEDMEKHPKSKFLINW